jgi:hypothetical protein
MRAFASEWGDYGLFCGLDCAALRFENAASSGMPAWKTLNA